MNDKAAKAKEKLREQLRTKYEKKINKESDSIKKEMKWASEIHEDSVKPNKGESNKVAVEIDHKTKVLVDKSKCVQMPNGKWRKKQDGE